MSDAREETRFTANPSPERPGIESPAAAGLSSARPNTSRGIALAAFAVLILACGLGLGYLLFGRGVPRGNTNMPSTAQLKEGDGEIKVTINAPNKGSVTITLYRDGKPVATKDAPVYDSVAPPGGAHFLKLPLGTYEARLECVGYTTIVKTVVLRDVDKQQELHVALTKGEGVIILGGPSLQELDIRLKKLEEARGQHK